MAISRVLASGHYVLGPEVARFETAWAAYCGTAHCIGVASGTDALELALRSVGVTAGHHVLTVANAGGYTSAAALAIGAVPVFADVDPITMVMTAESMERALTEQCRAVVVTHLYGRLADHIEEIVQIASDRGIPVIEDCAQAAGARRAGRVAGSFGAAGAFSFYPTKNLAALGDGGAVVTGDAQVAEQVRERRMYGWTERYLATCPGGRNSRLDELQAAVLSARLPDLDGRNARRREVLSRYGEALPRPVGTIALADGAAHVAHLAVAVLLVDRDRFRAHLRLWGVDTDVHYPVPDYAQPVIARTAHHDPSATPVTAALAQRVTTLPCFPDLTPGEVDRVCEALEASIELHEGGSS